MSILVFQFAAAGMVLVEQIVISGLFEAGFTGVVLVEEMVVPCIISLTEVLVFQLLEYCKVMAYTF